MKKIILAFILGIAFLLFFVFFTLPASASLEINSSTYSGSFAQGSSSGNISNSSYFGDSASFYQQAIGYLNDLLFSGVHGFSFQTASTAGSLPSLSIIKPSNKTYITRINLPLNFTALNALSFWYNLDSGANTTITANTTFSTTNGVHTLYLYANNTYGNSSANVTFTVNTDKFVVHYNNYSGSTKGSSTDFNSSTYEELQNLSGVVLENTDYGEIAFNDAINTTNDSNIDSDLDLDLYINISNNSIVLNSTALPNFNKSATLSLYGLTFTNPRILRNGEVCPNAICTEVSYSGGIFVFNVTQFTNYSAEETPAGGGTPDTTSLGGGGGSGGVVYSVTDLFTLDKNEIKVSLNPGQVKTENVTITNPGTQPITITIENLIPDFVMRGEDVILLNPGESKVIPLYIIVKAETIPNLYLGKIIISSGSTKREILLAVEVESAGILLDVRAEILKDYKQILQGGEVLTEMRLFNLGGSDERKDVLIEYIIKDYENHEIVKETESLAIETQATFIKRIKLPQDAILGNYVLYVRAVYSGKVASSSDNFEIVASKVTSKEKIYIVIIIILAVILSLIIYFTTLHMSQHRTKRGTSKKLKSKDQINLKSIMKK
ncbi:MAG: hypothetical protein AABX26_03520 [Nanoarchaeota archaeon]